MIVLELQGVENIGNDTVAGILEDVENGFKAFGSSIIGVGHFSRSDVLAEVGCGFQFACGIQAFCLVVQSLHVGLVHREDEIECGEVGRTDGTRAMSEVVASSLGMLPHALVGQFTFVIGNESCGINGDKVVESCLY